MEFNKLKLKTDEVQTFNLHQDLEGVVQNHFTVVDNSNNILLSILQDTEFDSINQFIDTLDLEQDLTIWIMYPKGTSKLYKGQVNVNRNDIHTQINPKVRTVSQVALDSDWSAMRLRSIKFSK